MATSTHGIVAAGHPLTAQIGADVLGQGGNAFDAVVAAALASCVVEPLLTSLGGGGYLTSRTASGQVAVFDFFGQTPQRKHPAAELLAIHGDFGNTTQEFHIGMGSAAVPGLTDGLFTVQRLLGRVPMTELSAPAIELARTGVRINPFQARISQILRPIVNHRTAIRERFFGPDGELLNTDSLQRFPRLADCLDVLSREGPELFYRGEISAQIEQLSRDHGGHLSQSDLGAYRTQIRQPLISRFAGNRLLTNPVPSCGGTLIAHSLGLFERLAPNRADDAAVAEAVIKAMVATNLVRKASRLQFAPASDTVAAVLADKALDQLITELGRRPLQTRGTTQISVADRDGNIASMTLSNGEGNGYLIPGTDIHLNNYLGEEDLNPAGIGDWPCDQRMASMMAPTLVERPENGWLALGSGGSNRLRTAILQVLLNLLWRGDDLAAAIERPRLHWQQQLLSVEPGLTPAAEQFVLDRPADQLALWDQKNLFFGGVHAAGFGRSGCIGHGDSRRGGAVATAGTAA